eukprot:jgi/Phyca11/12594/fgenesh1_pg.PHYCAscaffold_1_\
MPTFESPYLYHLADASLFTVAKVMEVTCDEASCVTWCMELWKAEFKIGGEGHIVEIDETSLAKKRKYNRGRVYQEYWLFGGVERGTGRWFGRIVYDKRAKETLLPIIKRFIKPRTKILSEMFATGLILPESPKQLSRKIGCPAQEITV